MSPPGRPKGSYRRAQLEGTPMSTTTDDDGTALQEAAPAPAPPAAVPDAPYTLKRLEEMLGFGRGVITGLIEAGFVAPSRGARNEYRFTFQDVVLLRTAYQLRAARIPARRVLNSR